MKNENMSYKLCNKKNNEGGKKIKLLVNKINKMYSTIIMKICVKLLKLQNQTKNPGGNNTNLMFVY